nr:hypothetical protein BdHM001_35590 [Bdellovibrio sp. HM001]
MATSTMTIRSHDGASITGVSMTSMTDPAGENINLYSLELGATVFERGKNSINLIGGFGLRSHQDNGSYGAQYNLAVELERYVARPAILKMGLKLGDLGAPINGDKSNYQQVYGGIAFEF